MRTEQKIIVVGGGFAGVNFANKLANKKGFHVTIIDRNNYNFFPPLLYQVATGFLEMSSISYPFRKLFQHKKNISFRLAELQEVMPAENKIILSNGELFYDKLIIAFGTETNYFEMENIRKNALPMKTVDDALELRNYCLQIIEQATISNTPETIAEDVKIVIAGGGPTGVEIAGMIAEMTKRITYKDYPELEGINGSIILIAGGSHVLAQMSKQAQEYAFKKLTAMGVQVVLDAQVKDYADGIVHMSDGGIIATKTLIWTTGVTGKVLKGVPQVVYTKGNRLLVDEYNRVKNTENIYAIGDACLQTTDAKYLHGHPQLAQVAMQQGRRLAKNFLAQSEGRTPVAFSYFDKGSMAIIGVSKAVLDMSFPNVHLRGFIAWVAWLFVHLVSLVNYRNRLKTFFNWLSAFISKDQALRMIVRPSDKSAKTETAVIAPVAAVAV